MKILSSLNNKTTGTIYDAIDSEGAVVVVNDFSELDGVYPSQLENRVVVLATGATTADVRVYESDGVTFAEKPFQIDGFERAIDPSEASSGAFMDLSVGLEGYGKDRVITYYQPNFGEWSTPDLETMGKFICLHKNSDDSVAWCFIHETGMTDIMGDDATDLQSVPLMLKGQKLALGKSGQKAPDGAIWNVEGVSVAENTDPNAFGDSASYVDADGVAVADISDARSATYSTGNNGNVGSIVFKRGEYFLVDGSSETETRGNAASDWFVASITVGGGTFNQRKLMKLFPKKLAPPSELVTYDSPADVLGGEVEALQEATAAIIETRDEQPSSLDQLHAGFAGGSLYVKKLKVG